MKKNEAIKNIYELPSIYMNDNQKSLAKKIILDLQVKEIRPYYDFIMMRTDLGFKFDLAPETLSNRIAVVNQLKNMNINVNSDSKAQENENILIIGDNYEALNNLHLVYDGQIDIIYIDPPYNTEKAGEEGNISSSTGVSKKFVYSDKLGRNGWLNMMRERLVLAKDLLSTNGIIFVSIDDNQHAYLKILMDEIFGYSKYINDILWVSNKNGRQISKSCFAKTYENILMYSKSENHLSYKKLERKFAQKIMPLLYEDGKYKIRSDKKGKFILQCKLHNGNIKKFNIKTRKNLFYPIYTDGKKISVKKFDKSTPLLPPKNKQGVQGVWRWSKEKVKKDNYDLQVLKDKKGFSIYTKKRNLFYTPKDIIISPKISTRSGSNEMNKLQLEFDFPKPTSLIKLLISFVSKKNSIILDFFAGSGTTGHAVMQLNREDDGNRKFILVTNNENEIGTKITYERLYKIIKGKSTTGSNDFSWCKKNKPFVNTPLRVFNIKHYDVEVNQISTLDNIKDFSIRNLKLLNPSYDSTDLQVYYDLNGLNPLNEAQKKQKYSTDPLIHEKSELIRDIKKVYCTCGASFYKLKDLEKHINKNMPRVG